MDGDDWHCDVRGEILNILNFRRMLKELDSSQLCLKFAYGCQMVVEVLGCFDQCPLMQDLHLLYK